MSYKRVKKLPSHTSTAKGKCPKCGVIIDIRVKYKMRKEVCVCPSCYHEFEL